MAARAPQAAVEASTEENAFHASVAARLAPAKLYPPAAKVAKEYGRVVNRFTIEPNGSVGNVELTERTMSLTLNEEAMLMVNRAAPFDHPPNGKAVSFSVPIVWRLPDANTR